MPPASPTDPASWKDWLPSAERLSAIVGIVGSVAILGAIATGEVGLGLATMLGAGLGLTLLVNVQSLAYTRERLHLREQEVGQLRRWLEALPIALVRVDHEGRIATWTDAAETSYGLAEYLRGQPISKILGRQCLPPTHGQSSTRQHRVQTPDQSVRDLDVRWSAIEEGWLVSIRDVTAEQQLVNASQQDQEAAHQLSRNQSGFARALGRELRDPLHAMLGLAELLHDSDLTEDQRELVDTTRTAGRRLQDRLGDLLSIERFERADVSLETTDFHLRATVEDAVDLALAAHPETRVRVVVAIAPDLPELVQGDADQLRSIFRHVLDNAVRYASPGDIFVTVDGKASGSEEVSLSVTIRDEGPGINAHAQARVFEPFYGRGAGGSLAHLTGVGLGLTLARHLVVLFGGQIGLRSAVDEGTTVWFTLTLAAAPHAPRPRRVLEGLHVALLDGDDPRLEAMSVPLTHEGIQLYRTSSARDTGQLDAVITTSSHLARHPQILRWNTPMIVLHESWELPPAADIVLPFPVRLAELHDALIRATERDEAEDAVTTPIEPPETPPLVLVVEDDLVSASIAVKMLEYLGARGDVARSGLEALEKVVQTRYDLVLMDCVLPDIDGMEATERIRAMSGPVKRTPIVALTAESSPSHRQACLHAGMNDFMAKPVQRDALFATLQRWALAMNTHRPGMPT